MKEETADYIKASDDNRAENHLGDPIAADESQAGNRRHDFMQVAIAIKNDGVVVPSLSRPKPDPTRAANERADKNQQDPHQKTPAEHRDRKPTLLDRVITIAQRIRIH